MLKTLPACQYGYAKSPNHNAISHPFSKLHHIRRRFLTLDAATRTCRSNEHGTELAKETAGNRSARQQAPVQMAGEWIDARYLTLLGGLLRIEACSMTVSATHLWKSLAERKVSWVE
jgi:hypothetical protein